ncbi:MAG: hypothetical protein HFJ45_07490 [Clostridia bacterium]|nr:hypothetical protein [Clostridia bacterium]
MEYLVGSLSAMIMLKLTENFGVEASFQVFLSALVAALTVGGKAFTKEIAKRNPTKIVFFVSKIISKFEIHKNKK